MLRWINIRIFLVLVLTIYLYSFTQKRNSRRKVNKTEVSFIGSDTMFLTKGKVNKLLKENIENISTIRKEKLDLNRLEKSLNTNVFVEKAEVFLDIDGCLKVFISQKKPIVRIFDSENTFYLDYNGNKMPLSDNFTDRVLIVYGSLEKNEYTSLVKLFQTIFDDEFLKEDIIGINIMPDGNLIMNCRGYNYQLYFGRVIDIDNKIKKYKVFYQNALQENILENYSKIDLRFDKMVVGVKY